MGGVAANMKCIQMVRWLCTGFEHDVGVVKEKCMICKLPCTSPFEGNCIGNYALYWYMISVGSLVYPGIR